MKLKNSIAMLIILIGLLLPTVFTIAADYVWFLSIGRESVFMTMFFARVFLGFGTGLAFLVFAVVNIRLALRGVKKHRAAAPLSLVAGFIALLIGLAFSSQWEIVLKYLNFSPFQAADPVFGLNVGVFVFDFPFFSLLLSYVITALAATSVLALLAYFSRQLPSHPREEFVDEIALPHIDWSGMKKAVPQLSVLLGLLFLCAAVAFQLGQWGLLFSSDGAAFGAGYTDVNVTLPLFSLLSGVSAVVGLLLLVNIRIKRARLPAEGIVAFVILLSIGLAASGVTQAFIVAPDEFNMEQPFIERSINATLEAYNLAGVDGQLYPVTYNLSQRELMKNERTLSNVRLWDFRPLIQTYNQLQLFRTYYNFNDVDIDRYRMNGNVRQVMVSAREMDTASIQEQAQTWVNRHLVFTHGYGLVMNPVDAVTAEGLPEFLIQNIPPASPVFHVNRSEIYFGEDELEYAIVGTTTKELDYPLGSGNAYTTYEGQSGIPLDAFRRLLYALKFGSIEILVSNSITDESRLLMNRNILDRVRTIAPFLTYDNDPYIVLADGRLVWMLDAYTTSSHYPYSQPFKIGFMQDINYIRNSVKVVVDAYSGDVSFYVVDQSDPLIKTYQRIFPSLFRPFSEMPQSLQEHVRYPEGIFRIQADIYSTYHMKDPRVFYNREDVWVSPEEVYRGNRQQMIPYYVILPLEGKEEFILMLPFVPRGKDNLISWMAARSDQPNYGKLTVFRFSKQKLVYGPLQIEARIDQDTDISALFTLWSQAGSSVTRGNTLVIPIENTILYIEPVFLEATEKGTLPQLKRVIVAYGNRLSMQSTLQEALDVVFSTTTSSAREPGITLPVNTPEDVLKQVAGLYNSATDALTQGDLQGYAAIMENIGDILSHY